MQPDQETRDALDDAVRRGLETCRTGKPPRPAVPADLREAFDAAAREGLAKLRRPEQVE